MTNTASSKRKSQMRAALLRLLMLLAILIGVNVIASKLHVALDLTQEHRFTLSPPTKTLLNSMEDIAVVDVYLVGKDLPAGFQRLQEGIRERLQSFKDVAGSKIQYKFEDPFEGKTEDQKGQIFQKFYEKGIMGMNLNVNTAEGRREQMLFPYAMVRYKGKEAAINLVENHQGMDPEQKLLASETLLEYKLASVLRTLALPAPPQVGWIMGNGESLGPHTFDALKSIGAYYRLDTVDLINSYFIPKAYTAIVICKPTEAFEEKEKFKLDQYVMNGGRILWMVDAMNANMDSLKTGPQQIALNYDLNLEDQLFKYGVRLNNDLIEDLQCNVIRVQTGMTGDQPQYELRNWQYFPIFTPAGEHPIVRNLEGVTAQFSGSIDTIASPGLKSTVLLSSSKYSRAAPSPVRVSLTMLAVKPQPAMYNNSYRPTAVLVEGQFQSIFANRMHPEFLKTLADSLHMPFQAKGPENGKMIVVADADIILNDYTQEGPMEMGFWKFTGERYGNKPFFLNCLEYLTDDAGLLEARSKQLKQRLLDGGRIQAERGKWQLINILVPLVLVLILGVVYTFYRKRKYERVYVKGE